MKPELIGYTNKLSVTPDQSIDFKISTELDGYEVTMVRLIHGDENPNGPGFKEEVIETTVNGKYPGRRQVAHGGSYLVVRDLEGLLSGPKNMTLQAWICPSTPLKGEVQGLMSKWSVTDQVGYGLMIGPGGDLELWLGDGIGEIGRVNSGKVLQANQWCFVGATIDTDRQRIALYQQSLDGGPRDVSPVLEGSIHELGFAKNGALLLVAAAYGEHLEADRPVNQVVGQGLYNGKIDSPRIFSRALRSGEMTVLARDVPPEEVGRHDLVAAWDFALDISTSRVTDTGPNQLHAVAVNMPARAVTGHLWSGQYFHCDQAPSEYGAIHFHEDDLEDAGWRTDFTLAVPAGLNSGIYAARLDADGQQDHIPFFVRPKKGSARASAVLLIPTMTYMAYANERMQSSPQLATLMKTRRQLNDDPLDRYLSAHPELSASLYDHHVDGSGFFYSSRLRPITNLRPKYRKWAQGGPRYLAGELYLVDWLEHKQFEYDVITDEDLHAEGMDLLQPYRVVLTGRHPEYWTADMLTALDQYLIQAGRLMYLGGNGFYWVTSVSPEKPHVIEVRRGYSGSRTWESDPGECCHSTTGELGGLWRHRGKAPNKLVGVGCSAMGWGTTSPGYTRRPDSFDRRAAFIFEGIGNNEIVGNFGLAMGGAAGDELDRSDGGLGTPRQALVVASSKGHSDHYQQVIEDINQLKSGVVYGGSGNTDVRSDMVYFETGEQGQVFSVGSISWCGSLSHNQYDNNVSRITENVLRHFMR